MASVTFYSVLKECYFSVPSDGALQRNGQTVGAGVGFSLRLDVDGSMRIFDASGNSRFLIFNMKQSQLTNLLNAGYIAVSPGAQSTTAVGTVGATTISASALASGYIARGGTQSAAFTDSFDTAANIIAAIPSWQIGDTRYVRYKNNTSFNETLTPGTGVTFVGNHVQTGNTFLLAANTFSDFLMTYTAAGAVSIDLQYVADQGVDNFGATGAPTVANDNTQGYGPGSMWIDTVNKRSYECVSAATGAASWAFSGADYVNGGLNPSIEVTQFGAGTGAMAAEGNISRQISSTGVQPATTASDVVLAVYSIPANSFDIANRAITVTAAGAFGATVNTKTVKLIFNPATATVGSTVGAGGTTLCTTGAVTQNGGGWALMGTVMKYGASGSNTQMCINNGAVGTTHFGVTAPSLSTAVESGSILIAVTGNAATAATDITFNWLEVNAMN